uniref:Uncharacterized protein n=1 Tax=Hucho hucho TaxID=62062 RepID=A0A4W5Q355_9TELE
MGNSYSAKGAIYNIICVPPTKTRPENLEETLEEATVVCSITTALVYNTMCRVFPWRFVLPLNVDMETLCWQNLNTRPDSTATATKTVKDKVFCTHEDLHDEELHKYGGLEFPQINYAKYNTK